MITLRLDLTDYLSLFFALLGQKIYIMQKAKAVKQKTEMYFLL